MLMATELVLRWLPKVVLDLAQVIHYYEAVLAALAILVWHFYAVIFDPHEYPMNPAWLILTKRSAHAPDAPAPDALPPDPDSAAVDQPSGVAVSGSSSALDRTEVL
jgi:hypothetical protein